MAKLTEPMIIARTKCSDLNSIKKLNCWGNELTDVSLVQRMPNIEVLALSVNNISSLADFQHCSKLRELYLRRNSIKSLNEICYLQYLPNLKNLTLSDNPCTETDVYRLSVLRTLPRLEKLDDEEVSEEERRAATRQGRELIHPEEMDQSNWCAPSDTSTPSYSYEPQVSNGMPAEAAPAEQCWDEEVEESEPQSARNSFDSNKASPQQISPDRQSPEPQRYYQEEYADRRNANYENSHSPVEHTSYTRNSVASSSSYQPSNQYQQQYYQQNASYYAQDEDFYRQPTQTQQPRHRFTQSQTPTPLSAASLPRKSRTSNILSAVLCLLKELDYQSLEVVDTTVNARMNELMHEHEA